MPALGSPIVIDGSHGEGGGTLVRTSLVMACLTQQPVRIDNVRGGSKYPGLDFEDLVLLRALARSCNAEATGVEVGSNSVSLLPTHRPASLNGDITLTGLDVAERGVSVPVVLNALLPVLARAGAYSQLALTGETYGVNSLSFDYFQNVTLSALRKFGLYAFADQEGAGFGRGSAGRVSIDVEPSAIQAVDWSSRGRLLKAGALVATAELPPEVGTRGAAHLEKLAQQAGLPLEVEACSVDSSAPGAFVTTWVECEHGLAGGAAMGRRGLRIESLAQSALQEALDWLAGDATVDPFLADQILIPACLADGETLFKISRLTQRFLTSVWVIKQFLPIHITVLGSVNQPGSVDVKR